MTRAEQVADVLFREQARLVSAFEEIDGVASFGARTWSRSELGGGTARILEDGAVFERAGINVSLVGAGRVPESLSAQLPAIAGLPYRATGISMVFHPVNPYAPSFHANFRYFEVGGGDGTWWFGGGMDLTPAYGFEDDARHFHSVLKHCCDRHDPSWYPRWKDACDRYFVIPHRNEMRGVGGIFFDHLSTEDGIDWHRGMEFVGDGLDAVVAAYAPIVSRRSKEAYGPRQRQWQLLRRGRYVEFNLVYDRGTLFGLQTKGNIEAIFMSLPPHAAWAYDVRPEPSSPESELDRFLQPHDWVAGPEEVRHAG